MYIDYVLLLFKFPNFRVLLSNDREQVNLCCLISTSYHQMNVNLLYTIHMNQLGGSCYEKYSSYNMIKYHLTQHQ